MSSFLWVSGLRRLAVAMMNALLRKGTIKRKDSHAGSGTARADGSRTEPRQSTQAASIRPPLDNSTVSRSTSFQSEITQLVNCNREQATQLAREVEANFQKAREIARLEASLVEQRKDLLKRLEAVVRQKYEVTRVLHEENKKLQAEKARLYEENERLQSENERLRYVHVVQLQAESARLKEEKATLDEDKVRLQGEIAELRKQHLADIDAFKTCWGDFWAAQIRCAQEEKAELQTRSNLEYTALQNDFQTLFESNQQCEADLSQQKAKGNEQNERIRDLERRLTLALQPNDEESPRAFDVGVLCLQAEKALQITFETFEAETTNMTRKMEMLSSGLRTKLEERENHPRMLELQLAAIFGPNPTPRQFLFARSTASEFPRCQQVPTARSPFIERHQVEHLTVSDLDIPLAGASIGIFLNSIRASHACQSKLHTPSFTRCSKCKRHKISDSPADTAQDFIEYPRWFQQNRCSTCDLCIDCLKEKLERSIAEDWWYELDSPHWLKCPIDGCCTPLGVDSVDSLVDVLRDFSNADVACLSAMYIRAMTFRAALMRAMPRPDMGAISASIGLHQQLSAFGLLSDDFTLFNAKDNVDPGEVFIGDLDRGSFKIPIFTKFLRRAEVAVDCSICLESFNEIEIASPERWTQACKGYQGSWMSDVFSFPTKETLHCDHDIDFCRQCFRRHLECQLEHHGRNAEGRLTCPSCSRVLSEQEVRSFGSAETVQR